MTEGGRNLTILGVASIIIAVATAGVSLLIYHNTGDIYLDRSRPGFLPDEEEIEQEEDTEETDFKFDSKGALDKKVLEEYLKEIEIEIKAVDNYENPFDANALSDERLGI